MKKLFALMLALMLALGGVSAVGAEETAAAPEVVEAVPEAPAASSGTIHLKVNLNADTIAALAGAANETAAKQVPMIVELVNSLDIAMTSDGKDAEMVVSVKDTPIANLGVIKDGEKMLLVSDLFPSYALAVSSGDMGAMTGGMSGFGATGFAMPQVSLSEEQMGALAAPFTKVLEDLQTKVGAPEAVEETMYGAAFTVKTPVNLTTKEFLEMILPAVKEVVSQEAFSSVLEQMKARGMQVNFSAEDIDKAIADLSEKKEEELPAMNASVYSNEAGDSLFAVNLTKEADVVDIKAGSVAGGFVTDVDVSNRIHFLMQGGEQGRTLGMQLQIQEDTLLNIDGDVRASEENFTAAFDVQINDAEVGTLQIDGTPNGVLSRSYTTEGKTEISVADLQDQKNETAQKFMTSFQMGLMMAMGKIAQAVPGFAEIMQQMTAPQGAPQK